MFGGAVERTYGEVTLEPEGGLTGTLKVHRIASDGNYKIGLEIVYLVTVELSDDSNFSVAR